MDKSILISIQPQHVENILNGKKTLEIRKTVPKGFKGWVYIYCTKSKPLLTYDVLDWDSGWVLYDSEDEFYSDKAFHVNGKVVARFWLGNWNTIYYPEHSNATGIDELYYDVPAAEREKLCLEDDDIKKYGKGKDLYAWHIKKLEVFDKTMELSDFKKEEYAVMPNGIFPAYQRITKAPQSWMFVWEDTK